MTIPNDFEELSIDEQIQALMFDAGARGFEIQTAQMANIRRGQESMTLAFVERDRRAALGLALEVRRLRRNRRISNFDARVKLLAGAELMREIHRNRPYWQVRP